MSHPSTLMTDPSVVLAGLADLLAAGAPLADAPRSGRPPSLSLTPSQHE